MCILILFAIIAAIIASVMAFSVKPKTDSKFILLNLNSIILYLDLITTTITTTQTTTTTPIPGNNLFICSIKRGSAKIPTNI